MNYLFFVLLETRAEGIQMEPKSEGNGKKEHETLRKKNLPRHFPPLSPSLNHKKKK